MNEEEIREEIRKLMRRKNIDTSHIQTREYSSTWSKVWSVIKSAVRIGAPIVGAIATAFHLIPCVLM